MATQKIRNSTNDGWTTIGGGGGGGYGSVTATGGTTSTVDGYKYHDFTADGTFEITALGTDPPLIEVLMAGGGGGGGTGGGGAGQVVVHGFDPAVDTYSVTIGEGGTDNVAGIGPGLAEDSTVTSTSLETDLVAVKGGGGGYFNNVKNVGTKGSYCHDGGMDPGHQNGVQYGFGNNGGIAWGNAAGGGGGAGGAGAAGDGNNGGDGGAGVTIWGYTLGGGGGGGAYQNNTLGTGGSGIGGDGQNSTTSPTAATANTGSGGGGGYNGGGGSVGTDGADGRVIFRYPV